MGILNNSAFDLKSAESNRDFHVDGTALFKRAKERKSELSYLEVNPTFNFTFSHQVE